MRLLWNVKNAIRAVCGHYFVVYGKKFLCEKIILTKKEKEEFGLIKNSIVVLTKKHQKNLKVDRIKINTPL